MTALNSALQLSLISCETSALHLNWDIYIFFQFSIGWGIASWGNTYTFIICVKTSVGPKKLSKRYWKYFSKSKIYRTKTFQFSGKHLKYIEYHSTVQNYLNSQLTNI